MKYQGLMRWKLLGMLLLSVGSLASNYIPPAPQLDDNAYVLMDYQSGMILAASNPDRRLGPASLTKLMTSYIVEQALMKGTLQEDDEVSVSEHAWRHGSNQESTMFLPLHGQAKVIDLLRGIIIVSANDACSAIAEHMAGTESAFADMMNNTAKELGLTNTHYMNASGLPDPEHYSTARDLAVLSRHIIMDNRKYYGIYSEHDMTWGGHHQGNRNALLYTDPSVDGLKTGHTEESGYSLVASAHRQNMRLIAVVLGTHSMQARADQARALLNWGFSFYQNITPYKAGTQLTQAHVWYARNDSVPVGLASDLAITIPKGSQNSIKATMELDPHIVAPIHKGAVVGHIDISLDGKTFETHPLVALTDDDQASLLKRIWQHILMFLEHIF